LEGIKAMTRTCSMWFLAITIRWWTWWSPPDPCWDLVRSC